MKNSSKILVISKGLLGKSLANNLSCNSISHKDVFSENFENYDYVINASFDKKMLENKLNNDAFDYRLINKAAEANSKFIFFSTRKVYGPYNGKILKEDSMCSPKCFYGINKYALEKYIQRRMIDNNYLILRLPNIYDSISLNKKESFLGTFTSNLLNENTVKLNCSLKAYKDFLSIRNLLIIFNQIYCNSKLNGSILNITIGEKIALGLIVDLASKYFKDLKIESDEAVDDSFLLSNYLLSEYANISECISNKIELDNHFKFISTKKI
tara:strand:- start:10796 stop:11602 length:807 start_codon:yes stop_codon:yes gene_type:complete